MVATEMTRVKGLGSETWIPRAHIIFCGTRTLHHRNALANKACPALQPFTNPFTGLRRGAMNRYEGLQYGRTRVCRLRTNPRKQTVGKTIVALACRGST